MGSLVTKRHVLTADVPVGGSFTTTYPSGYTQAALTYSLGGHVRVNDNEVYTQNVNADFSFGASTITITNSSLITWPAGSYLILGFGRTARFGSNLLTIGPGQNRSAAGDGSTVPGPDPGDPNKGAGVALVARNIAARGQLYTGQSTPPATKTYNITRSKFLVWAAAQRVRAVWANKYLVASAAGEANGSQAIDILQVAFEKGGQTVPAKFSGNAGITISAGALDVACDWADLSVAPGETVWIRQKSSVVDAASSVVVGKFYNSTVLEGSGLQEQSIYYTPANDIDQVNASGLLTSPTGGVSQIGYTAMLLIGEVEPGVEAIVGIGDSIADGTGDFSSSSGVNGGGFLRRAAHILGKPYCSAALPSTTAGNVLGGYTLIQSILKYHATKWVELGTNDVALSGASSSTLLGRLRQIWALNTGTITKTLQSNMLPRCGTTNQGATLAGQSPSTGFQTGQARDQFNLALPSEVGSNGLTGYTRPTTVVEDPGTPAKWAIRSYVSTLAASALSSASTLSLNAAPSVGESIICDLGGANESAGAYAVASVSGSGPYSCVGVIQIGTAQSAGASATATPSRDCIHPAPIIAALAAAKHVADIISSP